MSAKKNSFVKRIAAAAVAAITLTTASVMPTYAATATQVFSTCKNMTVTFPLPTNKAYKISVLAKYSDGGSHNSYISGSYLKIGWQSDPYCVMDIGSAAAGTDILAIADGTVIESGFKENDLGNYILLGHKDGSYSVYGHMQSPSPYKKGDTVKCGTKIGKVGMTGNSKGVHLHFEWSGHDAFCEFKNMGYDIAIMSNSGASVNPHDHTTYYTAKVSGTDGSLMINSVAKAGYTVGSIPEGAVCKVYPDRSVNNWLYVEYNGVSGYSYKSYLKTASSGTAYYVKGTDGTLVINSRASAGYGIGSIPEGAKCTVDTSRTVGNWVWTTYNGVSGYCYKTYLTITAPATTYYVKGTDGSLVINSRASAGYGIGSIPEGGKCTVDFSRSSGNWWYVTYNGVSGYSYKSYLTTTAPAAYRVKGTDGSLMINSKASAGCAIGSIPEGAVCTVNSSKSVGNWWYVTYNGKSGYSYKTYLVKV